MMPQQDKPFERAVPYKTLEDGDVYLSIQDGQQNWVLKINLKVMKVTKIEGQKDPAGRQLFNYAANNNAIVLTPDEYKAMTGRTVEL